MISKRAFDSFLAKGAIALPKLTVGVMIRAVAMIE